MNWKATKLRLTVEAGTPGDKMWGLKEMSSWKAGKLSAITKVQEGVSF